MEVMEALALGCPFRILRCSEWRTHRDSISPSCCRCAPVIKVTGSGALRSLQRDGQHRPEHQDPVATSAALILRPRFCLLHAGAAFKAGRSSRCRSLPLLQQHGEALVDHQLGRFAKTVARRWRHRDAHQGRVHQGGGERATCDAGRALQPAIGLHHHRRRGLPEEAPGLATETIEPLLRAAQIMLSSRFSRAPARFSSVATPPLPADATAAGLPVPPIRARRLGSVGSAARTAPACGACGAGPAAPTACTSD